MGLVWVQGSPAQFENIGREWLLKARSKVYMAFDEVTKEAADKMRQAIQSGGANPTQKGGPRVDTGLMLESVQSTFQIGGDAVTGTFGWTETNEVYFLFQEAGTSTIPAMLALTDASQWAAHEIIERVKAALG